MFWVCLASATRTKYSSKLPPTSRSIVCRRSIYIHHAVSGGIYNDVRFWATATGAASRERPDETAREEEGGNSESAARSKCGYVCLCVRASVS